MQIRQLFRDDINRKINGVVKVDQDATDVIVQEVEEYVITRDLKKHFITFFKNYSESFAEPVSDIGVWISGFFGSGKSHFIKILSYILENRVIAGKSTVDRFERKLEDNRDIFETMKQCTQNPTDTILFNIDIVGPKNKSNTAVLQVFAKMFYNHCGYFGENLKVALMEQYIDSEGKFDEFKRAFARYKGKPWEEQRRAFAFNGNAVKAALVETLGISEADAQEWFSNKKDENYSIETLVKDIKSYVDRKPAGYRLMFMADEVGQYVGEDTSLLLNLQSIVEEIGAVCEGKVWVICTGQEAIDEIIKARENEFSRIQARFKTRLSLTSSSVDEVIQERILKKKPEYEEPLREIYNCNEAVMRNLFSFTDALRDIKGYGSANEFAKNFPFVPYQFLIMPKTFTEIRKHGNAGMHLGGGERSMLSCFQEAAQKIQDRNEFSIAPFYMFYDTVHTFLDSSIRKVVDRAQKAAEDGNGLEGFDVQLLKLLYLIRYVDDIPANLDNLIILMADDINLDKIVMREQVRDALDRLMSQNYIARTGDTYTFLTDEEQDIAREIKNTVVDTANIVSKIGEMIFAGIYTTKKFRYDKYDFAFDQYVDQAAIVNGTGGVTLQVLTAATYGVDRNETKLAIDSKGKAIVVLSDAPYFENLENAMKIRKYVKQRNVSQLPKSIQDIIRDQQDEAGRYENSAKDFLKKAIEEAQFYVDGEKMEIGAGDAKAKIDVALKGLIERVYNCLGMIDSNFDTDGDLIALLTGMTTYLPGTEPNQQAVKKVSEYLEMQYRQKLPTSMADVQKRYQSVPYGWREIDVATVVAQLIVAQKVDIKYAGESIRADNPKLPDMLRKRTETGKTQITIHQSVTTSNLREAKEFLTEYFDVMDVPADEKGLVEFVFEKFTAQKAHYEGLLGKYDEFHRYPDKMTLQKGLQLTEEVLSKSKDNIALINAVIKNEEDLLDSKDDLQNLEDFFKTQVNLYDHASRYESTLRNDLNYINEIPEAKQALDTIRLILMIPTTGKYAYKRIPELSGLISTVRTHHDGLLQKKREELLQSLQDCTGEVHQKVTEDPNIKAIANQADEQFTAKKQDITSCTCLALLDGMLPQLWSIRDNAISKIDLLRVPVTPPTDRIVPIKNIKSYQRQAIFTSATLNSDAEVDAYVENVKNKLKELLSSCDGIRIN